MTTYAQSLLEGANGVTCTTGNTGASAVNGGWAFDTSVHPQGASSAKATTAGGVASMVWIHPVATVWGYDWKQQLSSLDGGSVLLAQVALGAANRAQVWLQADGTIALRNGTVALADPTPQVFTTGAMARFALFINGSTMTLRIWQGTLTGTVDNTISGTYSQGTFDRIKIGSLVAHAHAINIDDVTLDDSGFPGTPNQIPVAALTASPNPATSGNTVTLDATTSSDPDGTVASYAFSQNTGPSTPLSGSGATRTLLAPVVASDTPAQYAVVVTDNAGATSLPATVNVTFKQAGVVSTADWSELCEGGNNGVTVTTANAPGFSSVDAGITFGSSLDGLGSHSIGGTTAVLQVATALIAAGLVSSWHVDFAYQLDALPAAGQFHYICEARSGSTVRASIRVDSAGKLQIRAGANGTTAVGTATTAVVTAGQPFRVGWSILNGATTSARLFTGANLLGGSADSGGTTSGSMTSGTFDRVRWGQAIAPSASVTWHADSLQGNAAGPPAVLGGGGGGGGSAYVALMNGGTAGGAATTGNTNLDSIATGLTFTSDAIGDGSLAVFCTVAGTTAANAHLFTAATVYYMDWVHRVSAYGDGTWIIAGYYSGASTPITQLRTNADGTISIRNGTTAVKTSATVFVPGMIVRFAWQLNGAAQTLRIYFGSNLWGTVPNETLTGAAPNATADRFRVGAITSQTVTYTLDSLRGDPTTWPAPISDGTQHTPGGSNIYVAHGGVWQLEKSWVAHGGTWQEAA